MAKLQGHFSALELRELIFMEHLQCAQHCDSSFANSLNLHSLLSRSALSDPKGGKKHDSEAEAQKVLITYPKPRIAQVRALRCSPTCQVADFGFRLRARCHSVPTPIKGLLRNPGKCSFPLCVGTQVCDLQSRPPSLSAPIPDDGELCQPPFCFKMADGSSVQNRVASD